MLAIQSRYGLLDGVARSLRNLGRAVASLIPAEPAPYWTDYLRETRDRRS